MRQKFLSISAMIVIALFGSMTKANADSVVTAMWPFTLGTDNPNAAEVSVDNVFTSTGFEFASNIQYNAKEPVRTLTAGIFSEVQPIVSNSNATAPADGDFVKFSIAPKKGIKFTPTSISFNAAKMGTGGGTIDVLYCVGSGSAVTVATAQNPARNNASTSYSFNIDGAESSGDAFVLMLGIYNLANNKALALDSIKIEGTYSGTAVEAPSYILTTSLSDEAAGSITASPANEKYDEGTTVKLTASENFSYHFQKWTDNDGNTVSTDNPYTFNINANTALKAVYTKNTVHSFKLNFTGGATGNLVDVAPVGNVTDGVAYYEEGTAVKLTASINYILTFTNWEDNTTTQERTITMDGDKEFTANYSAADYIVGWDMRADNPKSERAADYKSNTENAGLLSIHNDAGVTSSWLSHGVSTGLYNGKYCAINWKTLTDKYLFEISFSTIGYSNVKVKASLGCSFNAYSVDNWEYSTDGKNYTRFGQSTLTAGGWTDKEFALPDTLGGKQKVYVRFIPDYTSEIVGATTTVDGTGITDIFVTADNNSLADETAPILVSSIPSANATGASATGSVVLTFDEKVIKGATTECATLDGENLSATFSGKNAIFAYSRLKYDTQYTFHLPAGFVTDRNGNAYGGCDIIFTTMQRKQPAARLYDAIVAQDATGDFTTLQSAIDAAPTNRTTPYLIFVKAGTYKEHVDIPATKSYLHIIGQGSDRVFISDDKLCGGDNALSVDVGATVVDHAGNGFFEGVSFVNSYGKDKNAGPQALALYTMGDRIVLNKCGLYSYQDTYLTTKTVNYRHYLKDCFIEGAVDFIYGQGNVYFDACTLNIVRTSGGYIVAPNHAAATTWGYVFQNCGITAPGTPSETSVWLGRPWHDSPKTVYINTTAKVTIPATGWYPTMGGIPSIWADYNTMDGDGNPVDLSNRNNYYYYTASDGTKADGYAKNHLTDDEAAAYTIKNVLGGDDAWQPTELTEACDAPKPVVNGGEIEWEAVPYAICYVVTKNGNVAGFTTDCKYAFESGAKYSVQAANEYGGLSGAGAVDTATGISEIKPESALKVEYYNINGCRLPSLQHGINIIRCTDADGGQHVRKVTK